MNVLAKNGLHDIHDERWNVYGQFTYISSWKLAFPALPYANANGSNNSLVPTPPNGVSRAQFTLFFGLRPTWKGAELAYFVPEVIADTSSLAASAESAARFRTGRAAKDRLRRRLAALSITGTYLRRRSGARWTSRREDFGPDAAARGDGRQPTTRPHRGQLHDSGRLRQELGVPWDPRPTFFNMAFMTHAAWDFSPADARGYAWGGTAEGSYWDDWAIRIGRIYAARESQSAANRFF